MRCYYHNDADGRCAGAIVYKYYETCKDDKYGYKYIEVDYATTIDTDQIQLNETIVIVDFSFKPEVMEEVLKVTRNIVWIDHHKTAFEYKYSQELNGIRNVNYSGCELAWKYFFPKKPIPRGVELIGDRDKWAWRLDATAKFNEGLKLHPHQPQDLIWDKILKDDSETLSLLCGTGETCLRYRNMICEDYCNKYGFELEFKGYKCFAAGIHMFGSETFGERFDKYDICISFEFNGKNWIISLYSKEIDVSEIAKKYGGGGHTKASGFTSKKLPF